jgi:hypothetical protein
MRIMPFHTLLSPFVTCLNIEYIAFVPISLQQFWSHDFSLNFMVLGQ